MLLDKCSASEALCNVSLWLCSPGELRHQSGAGLVHAVVAVSNLPSSAGMHIPQGIIFKKHAGEGKQ